MEYIEDSLDVDDLNECMIANGWTYEEVEDLSQIPTDTLIQMIDWRVISNMEASPGNPYTATRLKEFLLDYYDRQNFAAGIDM